MTQISHVIDAHKRRNQKHELGALKGSFYRVQIEGRVLATFQSLTDSVEYAAKYGADLYVSDHREHGIEVYLISGNAKNIPPG